MMSKICIPVPLLLLLPLLLPTVCEGSRDLRKFGQHCYEATWHAARAHCRSKHTDLLTIRSEDENAKFFGGFGWIGLRRWNGSSRWKWSSGEKKGNFTPWHNNEPRNGKRCAYKYSARHTWRSSYCNEKRGFMCQEEKLFLVKENKTWEQALDHCRALEAVDPNKPTTAYQNHRYDLASLLTDDDHDEAREMMKHQGSTDEVWTGLRFLAGQWWWIDGGEVQYQGLNTCPTVSFCGVLNQNSTAPYETRQCTLKYNFLCYKTPRLC